MKKHTLFDIAVCALVSATVSANTWTNVLGGVFSDGGNWAEGVAPDASKDAVFNQPGSYVVRFDGPTVGPQNVSFANDVAVTFDVGRDNAWSFNGGGAFSLPNWPGGNVSMALVSGVISNFYACYVGGAPGTVHLTVANPGTLFATQSDDFQIGTGYGGHFVDVSNGAILSGGRGFIFGKGENGTNCVLDVTGAGSTVRSLGRVHGIWSGITIGESGARNVATFSEGARLESLNGGTMFIGYNASACDNVLTLSKGASLLVDGGAQMYVGHYGSGNSLVLDGPDSYADAEGGVWVGNVGSNNSLVVSNGATFFNASHYYVGINSGANGNLLLATGEGTILTNSNWDTTIGVNGSFNRMEILDGAQLRTPRSLFVGNGATASNNTALVSGEGSRVTLAGVGSGYTIYVGNSGSDNSLVFTDGAIFDFKGTQAVVLGQGNGARGNSLVVSDGASFTNMGNIYLGAGYGADGCSVTVSNATWFSGMVHNNAGADCRFDVLGGATAGINSHIYIGQSESASNSSCRVSGEGSMLWNTMFDLDVGNNAPNCRMDVEDGANVTIQRHVYVGHQQSASNCVLRIAGGSFTNNLNYGSWPSTLNFANHATLAIDGAGGTVDASRLNVSGGSKLSYTVDADGTGIVRNTVDANFADDTILEIDGMELAKAGGGWVDLLTAPNINGSATNNMVLLPENIRVIQTQTSIRAKIPNLAGTVLFVK